MQKSCSSCSFSKSSTSEGAASIFSTLMIAVIPKCPWCIMAYSSAIAMCGTESATLSHTNWISYLPITFSFLVIGLLVKKWRSDRSPMAILIAIISTIIIIVTHQNLLPTYFFDIGAGIQFVAVWYNGNFIPFYKKMVSLILNKKYTWQK